MIEMPKKPPVNPKNNEKQVPAAVFFVLIIIILAMLAFFIWLIFQKPSSASEPIQLTGVNEVIMATASDPFEVTPLPRDKEKIIISAIGYSGGNIARISFILPDRLEGSDGYIKDIPVGIIRDQAEKNLIHIDLPPELQSKNIVVSFRMNGEEKAACEVSVDDVSNPLGDCNW